MLTNPLPCGEDGEVEGGDVEVEEYATRSVAFFSCRFLLFLFDVFIDCCVRLL